MSALSLMFLLLISSCSLVWKNDSPQTAKGSEYKLSFSSTSWQVKDDQRSDYVVENSDDGRIMLSNSFCDEFQDQPLSLLAKKTFQAVSEFKVTKEEYTTFKNREAYLTEGIGKVDGVQVALKLLNTRRNNCYFDFLAISPLSSAANRDKDFDHFLNSVEFK